MGGTVFNLTFHGIGTPPGPRSEDERHVWLDPAGFEQSLDAVLRDRRLRITFDDGNRSDVEVALPALRRRGLRATFFVIAGRIGEPGYLTANDLASLVSNGMEIGCHGMHHRSWRRLDDAGLAEELGESRELIEGITGRTVRGAACPFGAYDRRVLAAARKAGYEQLFTSDGGPSVSGAWLQSRNTIGGCGDKPVTRIEALLRARPRRVRLGRAAKLRVKALR